MIGLFVNLRRPLLLAFALFAWAGAARSQAPAIEIVPLLQPVKPVRPHPLADADGRLPIVVELPGGAEAMSVGILPMAPGLGTLRVAPNELSSFLAKHPGLQVSVSPPKHTLLDRSSKLTRAGSFRARTGLDGSGVVVGIVDTGIDAAHDDFRTEDGKTRIAWMLDMSMTPAGELGHAELEAKFGCTDPHQSACRVLDAKMIDGSLQGVSLALPRDPVGHGTHVASIAAGDGGRGPDVKYVGVAPGATLVIARVTQAGGSEMSDPDIVTATRFIFDRAEALGLPAVVNISLGGDFGPHDGTSPLEKGLAALVGPAHPGRAIVVAAGNSGALYEDNRGRLYGVHTEVRVVPESRAQVSLFTPGPRDGSHVNGQAYVWITFRPGDDLTIGLSGPDGDEWIGQVSRGSSAGYSRPELNAGVIHGVVGDLTPLTEDTFGAIVAVDGKIGSGSELTITLEGHGTAKLWVQGGGDLGPGGIFPGVLFASASKEGTINVPATHPDLIAVGCTLDRVDWTDAGGRPRKLVSLGGRLEPLVDSSCHFSSAGPTATGVMKPEISAPGAFVAAAMSVEAAPGKSGGGIFDAPPGFCDEGGACFLVDDSHALLSGTSMSAPHVTGAVALLLSRDSSLTQGDISALLQAGARRPEGEVPYDFQLGPGALDVEGLIAAYELRGKASAKSPDAKASWMALSASYARPDPEWPVIGTVELRAGDGAVVDGFDPSRLALHVANGLVKKEIARIAPGLWRFEVAGQEGSGQTSMHVEVRFDGQVVGAEHPTLRGSRTLPIGVDKWVAGGELEARGGCSVASGRGPRTPGAGWAGIWGASVAWALWRRRRGGVLGAAAKGVRRGSVAAVENSES